MPWETGRGTMGCEAIGGKGVLAAKLDVRELRQDKTLIKLEEEESLGFEGQRPRRKA